MVCFSSSFEEEENEIGEASTCLPASPPNLPRYQPISSFGPMTSDPRLSASQVTLLPSLPTHLVYLCFHAAPVPSSRATTAPEPILTEPKGAKKTLVAAAAQRIPPIVWVGSVSGLRKSESENRSVMFDSLQPCGLHSAWNSPGQNIKPRLRKIQIIPSGDGFHPASEFSWCCAPHFHPWFLPKHPDLLDQATLCCSRSSARAWTLAERPGGRHARPPCTAHLLNFQVESASWIPQGSLEQLAWDFLCPLLGHTAYCCPWTDVLRFLI